MINCAEPYQSNIGTLDDPTRVARILVVDDDEAIRKLHAAMLTLEGYEVEMAEDGADALEQLADCHFDLVITDRQMPVLDGERLVLALRSSGIRIPVVMVSGSLAFSPLCAEVAREISASLSKPIRLAEIIAAVSTALKSLEHEYRAAA